MPRIGTPRSKISRRTDRRGLGVHRLRTAGEDDRLRRHRADLVDRGIERKDDGVDALFADAAGDELRVLRTEIEDENGLGHYRRFRSSLPGLKRIVLPGGIFTSTPVLGLRPIPFLRCLT